MITPFFGIFLASIAQAQIGYWPDEVKQVLKVDAPESEIEDKQWNRWTTDEFVVCTLDNNQGKYISDNIDKIKTWIITRWGFPDFKFQKECRIIGVDDSNLMKKWFGIDGSRTEIRKDAPFNVVFLTLNQPPSKALPGPLTEVCLEELEQKIGDQFGWWVHRGMSLLNMPISEIRDEIGQLHSFVEQDKQMFFSQSLLTATREQWNKMTKEQKWLFDVESMILCLMLRKEFGQNKFHWFLKETSNSNPETALKKIYGFDGFSNFDSSFKRFVKDLSNDCLKQDGGTPDFYLDIVNSAQKSNS